MDRLIAVLAFDLARGGVEPVQFVRWTVDQLTLYYEGRTARLEEARDSIERMNQAAKQNKVGTLVRYVVPLI